MPISATKKNLKNWGDSSKAKIFLRWLVVIFLKY